MVEERPRHQDSVQTKSPQEVEANDADPERPEILSADCNRNDTSAEVSGISDVSGSQDAVMLDSEIISQVDSVKRLLVERTENFGIPQLERLYTRIIKVIFETKDKGVEDDPKPSILRYLTKFAEDMANF